MKWRRAKYDILFQHTAARRRLGISESAYRRMGRVSTHSRPKAAGPGESQKLQSIASFNTQPPEGGWEEETETVVFDKWFQHTAARRRLATLRKQYRPLEGFNTQPPEGGWVLFTHQPTTNEGFNTQPPEGGWTYNKICCRVDISFNTQPPEGGWGRRRWRQNLSKSFNTQPPEGGWEQGAKDDRAGNRFNTQPPEGGWGGYFAVIERDVVSTHSRPKAAGNH